MERASHPEKNCVSKAEGPNISLNALEASAGLLSLVKWTLGHKKLKWPQV